MSFIEMELTKGIATLMLNRGKVNALNPSVVDELSHCLKQLEGDPGANAMVLTGKGKFFSFGFDIPGFLSFSKEEFTDYLIRFTDLYTYLFQYPKPVVAALNGHTIAGGCMLPLACDSRIMAAGKGKISFNEIGFGSSVLAGATEMLRFWVGSAHATRVLYSGDMYSPEAALGLGLVQEVVAEEELTQRAKHLAAELASKSAPAFASIKSVLRGPVVEDMVKRERESIQEVVDIWYSESTWANLQNITIR